MNTPTTTSRHQLSTPPTLSKEKLTSSKHNVLKPPNLQSTLKANRSYITTSIMKQTSTVYTGTKKATIARASSKLFAPPQIRDSLGNELTPQNLQLNAESYLGNRTTVMQSDPTQTFGEALYLQSIYNPPQGVTANKLAYKGSVYGATSSVTDGGTVAFQDSYYGDDLVERIQATLPGTTASVQLVQDEVEEELTRDDLEKMVEISLEETESIWLFDLEPTVFSTGAEDAASIQESNEKYLELKRMKEGNDRYVARSMQTFNFDLKDKSFQTSQINTQNIGVMATSWDNYDEFERVRLLQEEEVELASSVIPSLIGSATASKVVSRTASKQASRPSLHSSRAPSVMDKPPAAESMSQLSSSLLVSTALLQSNIAVGTKQTRPDQKSKNFDSTEADSHAMEILNSEALKSSLSVMEKAIMMNSYQPKQAVFRDLPGLPVKKPEETEATTQSDQNLSLESMGLSRPRTKDRGRGEDISPKLELLWTFKCKLVTGYIPLCIEFNKENTDIIAVGYISANPDLDNQHTGLVCCWSLKNPEFPDRFYKSNAGVCSLSFSSVHPSILAAGLTNGLIAIYNIRNTDPLPAIDSSTCAAKHTGTVWQVEWVERETVSGEEKSEFLVSSAADGRISQWTIRKGFECTELMSLKRSISKQVDKRAPGRSKQSSALISRFTPGLSFAFSKETANIYLVGTEDGLVHRCSCSYTEQYLKSFEGHSGPISRIRWYPGHPEYFLTCSSDWSIRIWHNSSPVSLFTFTHLQEDTFDAHWSPLRPTLFASITESSLELWDISISVLDPIYCSNPISGAAGISCFNFALNSECVVLGDSRGDVHVFKMQQMPPVQTVETMLKTLTGTELEETN